MRRERRAVIIGIGNEYRRDDGVGPAVVASLRGQVPPEVDLLISDGEPAGLIDDWAGAELVIVVDAIAGTQAGLLHRIVLAGADPGRSSGTGPEARMAGDGLASSHGLGLGTAVQLAAALGRLPGTLIMHGVEAADFGQGTGLSADVAGSMAELTAGVLADAAPTRSL